MHRFDQHENCDYCKKVIAKTHLFIKCALCKSKLHIKCNNIDRPAYKLLKKREGNPPLYSL